MNIFLNKKFQKVVNVISVIVTVGLCLWFAILNWIIPVGAFGDNVDDRRRLIIDGMGYFEGALLVLLSVYVGIHINEKNKDNPNKNS